ncbi:MAG: hypothetical protein HYV16_01670 [Gammaproteobacteria bacterium]|nr:hypothetical protein [Gammaproteobacteria bacterium]
MKSYAVALFTAALMLSGAVFAEEVKTIHLEEYNGYFSAKETLAGLKPGKYRIEVSNKAGKLVGFQIQNAKTHEQLDMFPLEVGETKTTEVTVTEDGFRYRCPINPTAWYDVDSIQAK